MLAAIGEVVVDATALEYALARLVAARCGWDAAQTWALTASPGRVRDAVRKLAQAEKDWDSLRRLYSDSCALLDDRNVLVHSLVVDVMGEDMPSPRTEIWHPRSGTAGAQPTAAAIEEHAFDLRRCFGRAIQLMREAEDRCRTTGPLEAVPAPKPLGWQAPTA